MYRYFFKKKALPAFKKLPFEVQKRILDKLDYFIKQKYPLFFASRLINYGLGEYRFRIGDYRVIFDLEDEDIIILEVGHRREIYK